MTTNRRLLIVLFITLSMTSLVSSDLLPFPACFILQLSFKSLGCAAGTSLEDYCVYMSWALRLQLENGEGLCSVFPCIGYEQSGRECTSLFPRSCRSSNRISEGICPVGEKSGVSAFLHEENKNIAIVGCPCHRINVAALKAANILPYKIDQLLIDIYFFLDKSSKRVVRLKELQEILGCGCHEVLKHVNTRWLSLSFGPCVSRLLELWEPISALSLELSEEKASKSTSQKAQGIMKKLLSYEVKAYAMFLENVVRNFEDANTLLQLFEPLIHKISDIMKSIIHNL